MKGVDMNKRMKRILTSAAVAVAICAILLGIHMIVNNVDFAGLLKSMHGSR
jgi:hypothetical protein